MRRLQKVQTYLVSAGAKYVEAYRSFFYPPDKAIEYVEWCKKNEVDFIKVRDHVPSNKPHPIEYAFVRRNNLNWVVTELINKQ